MPDLRRTTLQRTVAPRNRRCGRWPTDGADAPHGATPAGQPGAAHGADPAAEHLVERGSAGAHST
ncbi:MAG: hypothetical protein JJU45_05680 [Acidimicrobiia bacterium]|nr:hypothetical protein [Acidimicrobiia bacterium]